MSLLNWTIQHLKKSLKDKTINKSEIINQSISRAIETRHLNAFVTITEKLANKQASNLDESLPLYGVPIAIKDNFCVKHVKTTCGSRILSNFTPTYSATVVERLFQAGAILIGKTNLDEFGMGSGCVDSIHGPTYNQWNSQCISGGSSGGSAVAVASGAVVAALGSDTGGSTRNPASYNGVVGFKPTYGSVSRSGLIPLVNSMDVPGILARNVSDITEIFNVISGWDKNDSTTVKTVPKVKTLKTNLKGITIGIPLDYYTEYLSNDVLKAWTELSTRLSESGAVVKEVRLPHTKHSIAVYSVLNQCEVASNMARYTGLGYGLRGESTESTEQLYAETRAIGLGDVVRRRILCGNYFLLSENYSTYFEKALRVRRRIVQDFDTIFSSGVDVLLTPVTLSDAPLMETFKSKDSREQSALQDFCTQPANMAGIPAIALPVGLSTRGLPISLQLMAQRGGDALLLGVAKCIEDDVGFHKLPCS